MPPGVGPGAKSHKDSKKEKKKRIKRRGDFSAKIMFSSISMSTFSDWMGEKFVDTRGANVSTMPVTNLAWSQPEGSGYTADGDETIFVDCSSNKAEFFNDSSIGNERIQVYLGFAISKLKAILKHKTKDGLYGVVHCIIIGYHPCEKLMFALSELLGNSTAYSYVYSSFIGYIIGQDEYRLSFRGVQSDGWKLIVDYVGVFDPYKSEVEDKKGMSQRVEEMGNLINDIPKKIDYSIPTQFGPKLQEEKYNNALDEWKNKDSKNRDVRDGKPYVQYEGEWMPESQLKGRYNSIVNPNLDEMKKTLADMEASLAANKQRREKRSKEISAILRDPYNGEGDIRQEMLKEDYQYLVNNSPDYRYSDADKYDTEGYRSLNRRGLLLPDYFFEGKQYYNNYPLANELSQMHWATESEENDVQKQRDAVAAKEEAIKNSKVAAVQILIAVASIPFPWLALVDIAITMYQWKSSDSLGTKALNGAGIAFDIAGLIPYFGTVFKTIRIASTAGEIGHAATTTLSNADTAFNIITKNKREGLDAIINNLDDAFNAIQKPHVPKTPAKGEVLDATINNLDNSFNAIKKPPTKNEVLNATIDNLDGAFHDITKPRHASKGATPGQISEGDKAVDATIDNLDDAFTAIQKPTRNNVLNTTIDNLDGAFHDITKPRHTTKGATPSQIAEGDKAIDATIDNLDEAFDTIQKPKQIEGFQQPPTKDEVIDATTDNLNNAFDSAKGDPNASFTGEPVPDLNTELNIVINSSEGSESTLTAIRLATGEDSIGTAFEKIINPHYINAIQNLSSFSDICGLLGDIWVRGVGIGYNGIMWLKGEGGEAATDEQLLEQKKKAELFEEYTRAQNEEFQAQQAFQNANSPEEKEAAKKELDRTKEQSQKMRKELGIAEPNFDMPAPGPIPEKPQLDAKAELKQAEEDYEKAKKAYGDAYKNGGSLEEKDAAWEAMVNADQRKKAAQNAIDAGQTSSIFNAYDSASEADEAYKKWEEAEDNAWTINHPYTIVQDDIAPDDSPLGIMIASENERITNNQNNAQQLHDQLYGPPPKPEHDIAEEEAYNAAIEANYDEYLRFQAEVEAEASQQELGYQVSQRDKHNYDTGNDKKKNKKKKK